MTKSFFSELELYTLISDQVEMVPMPAKSAILADLYTGVPLGVYTMMRTYEHNKFCISESILSVLINQWQRWGGIFNWI